MEVDLPPDALPSSREFQRDLEAVTIDHQLMDEDLQEEIFDYFRQAEEDNLEVAVNHFDGEFTHEELQLMRIQFLSDMGN